jgi:hypothetical protein
MPTESNRREAEQHQAPAHADAVSAYVLRTLGRPPDLVAIQARHLWGLHYRVNVFVGDIATARISHSYFVSCNEEGHFVSSHPIIAREFTPVLPGMAARGETKRPGVDA